MKALTLQAQVKVKCCPRKLLSKETNLERQMVHWRIHRKMRWKLMLFRVQLVLKWELMIQIDHHSKGCQMLIHSLPEKV